MMAISIVRFVNKSIFHSSTATCKHLIGLSKIRATGNPQFISSQVVYSRAISSATTNRSHSDRTQWRAVVTRFIPIGICLIAVMQWRAYRRRSYDRVAQSWEINCYCMLPLRTVSRYWGWLANKELPEYARPMVYGLYAKTFQVNLSEAQHEDLRSYPSLGDFFARPLKENVRTIDKNADMVAPCDGTVLHFGTVHTGEVEQVKGVTYSLEKFLGENNRPTNKDVKDYRTSLLHEPNKGNTLYQCVLYLAPGDYHRFHSPVEWKATHRRHFHGELLSVSPRIAKWLPGLFCLNERVVYLGSWKHGFFSYTAVGATNVGTIKVYFDKNLQTNRPKSAKKPSDNLFLGNTINLHKGDLMGEFRMGSTIVLVFEAPLNFKFDVSAGDHVQMGQRLGNNAQHRDQKFVDTLEKKSNSGKDNVGDNNSAS